MRKLLRNTAIAVILSMSVGGLFLAGHAQERAPKVRNVAMNANVPVQAPINAKAPMNAKVPMCSGIDLAATYHPERAGGPTFEFAIHNGTDEPISIAMPAPTSAHWYALEGARWWWRASNGTGGSPVDAMNPRGPVFAFRVNTGKNQQLTVPAHGFGNWELKPGDNPVLTFKPSCPHCNHPADKQFRVVFAYAVLPGDGDRATLRCGLRTSPVEVPASYARLAAGQSAQSGQSRPVTVGRADASPLAPTYTSRTANEQ